MIETPSLDLFRRNAVALRQHEQSGRGGPKIELSGHMACLILAEMDGAALAATTAIEEADTALLGTRGVTADFVRTSHRRASRLLLQIRGTR